MVGQYRRMSLRHRTPEAMTPTSRHVGNAVWRSTQRASRRGSPSSSSSSSHARGTLLLTRSLGATWSVRSLKDLGAAGSRLKSKKHMYLVPRLDSEGCRGVLGFCLQIGMDEALSSTDRNRTSDCRRTHYLAPLSRVVTNTPCRSAIMQRGRLCAAEARRPPAGTDEPDPGAGTGRDCVGLGTSSSPKPAFPC